MSWKKHLDNSKTDLDKDLGYNENSTNYLEGLASQTESLTKFGFTTFAIEDAVTEMREAPKESRPMRATILREASRDLTQIATQLSLTSNMSNDKAFVNITDDNGKVLAEAKHSELATTAMNVNRNISTINRAFVTDLAKESSLAVMSSQGRQ